MILLYLYKLCHVVTVYSIGKAVVTRSVILDMQLQLQHTLARAVYK